MSLYVYDIETYPNIFTCALKRFDTGETYVFEWSTRRNDIQAFITFIHSLSEIKGCAMIGFNNVGFDYPVIHHLISNYNESMTVLDLFHFANNLINASKDEKFGYMIWDRERLVRQIDLFKINHFDNVAKFTSLKILEFNMRSPDIQDLPFPPGTLIPPYEYDRLVSYNINDVNETEKFYKECVSAIELRENLQDQFNQDIINYNDTKIGKDYLRQELEKHSPDACYYKDPYTGSRKPRQTHRAQIALGDVLLPYLHFEHPEFIRIHNWFKDRVITETKGSIKDLSCTINGFQFDFGTGGIHGSIESSVVESDDDTTILDIDVASFYPNLAIQNNLYPEHLSTKFCEIYKSIYDRRKQYGKGTPENKMFKLALNGTYGDSNNVYSPFYDPKFTMSITINGQLSLCMLAEQLFKIPGLQMIQINTDGLTVKVNNFYVEAVRNICRWWEGITKLVLEEAVYSRFFVRDVNNYIAEYHNGKLKRKGAYEYDDLGWHQNQSALVVPKAAEAFLVRGIHPFDFLNNHDDIMDFMLRTKVPRKSRLMHGDRQIQNVSRYYISNSGAPLVKIMPPLPKNPDKERHIGIHIGWNVTECNNIVGLTKFDINHAWYLQEIEKLIAFGR